MPASDYNMALLALAFEISTRNQSRLPSSDCPSIVLRGLPPPSPSLSFLHCKLSIVLQIFANLTKPKPRPRPIASLLPRFQCKHKQTNANKTRRRRPINKGPMRGWTHPIRTSVRPTAYHNWPITRARGSSVQLSIRLSVCPSVCVCPFGFNPQPVRASDNWLSYFSDELNLCQNMR